MEKLAIKIVFLDTDESILKDIFGKDFLYSDYKLDIYITGITEFFGAKDNRTYVIDKIFFRDRQIDLDKLTWHMELEIHKKIIKYFHNYNLH